MYYADILHSASHPDRYYYGSPADLKNRVAVHNAGGNGSTKPFRPWDLAWYKSVPVNGSDADRYYFRIVADYIHLNPARVGLAGGRAGRLAGYRWSSLP